MSLLTEAKVDLMILPMTLTLTARMKDNISNLNLLSFL